MVSDLYDYPWSSYPSYIDLTQNNPLVSHNRTLSCFRKPAEDEYRKFVEKNEEIEEGLLCMPGRPVLD